LEIAKLLGTSVKLACD